MNPSLHILKTRFGYDSFRPGQDKLVKSILNGRDVLGIMPTGAGKSICYQVPALILPGITLVISPLISLMQDQVLTLRRRGIRAEYINSSLSSDRKQAILSRIEAEHGIFSSGDRKQAILSRIEAEHGIFSSGDRKQAILSRIEAEHSHLTAAFRDIRNPIRELTCDSSCGPIPEFSCDSACDPIKLLYISPERLQTEEFRAFAQKIHIPLICVDEAHCISLWGLQFRPSYLKIAEFVKMLPVRPVLAAFTATANADVRGDILDRLKLREPYVLSTGFDRPNLYFEVQKPKDKWQALVSLLTRHRGECGIVYCLTRRMVEAISGRLNANGFSAAFYHGGMSLEERDASQRDWLMGRRSVIVATNAFGMGIDKPDVRFVIHYNMPGCMENYYQEAGRAGRDGLPSDCIMLYSYRDVVINRFFISRAGVLPGKQLQRGDHESVSVMEGVYVAIDSSVDLTALRAHERKKLAAMQRFAAGDVCLRAFMLEYFGEHAAPYCGKCSRCLSLLPFGHHHTALVPNVESASLYDELRRLRARLADRDGILPHKIFTDRNLHDFASVRPQSLPAMLLVEGVRWMAVLRYGREFVEEIRLFVQTN